MTAYMHDSLRQFSFARIVDPNNLSDKVYPSFDVASWLCEENINA